MKKCQYEYEEADRYVVLNDNDPDLRPIVLSLPKPPPLHLIDGYGLPPEEQRFHRLEIPRRLKDLEAEAVLKTKEDLSTNKNNVVTLLKIQKKFWELLGERHKSLKKEIAFIRKFWWFRLRGYWFFNNGKPTYITGWHFYYLNCWTMDVQNKVGYPDYRDRDRKEFLFNWYAYTTTETFVKLDKHGMAIPNEDGSYDMVDLGRRVCYGTIQPKNRRSGNTNKALSNGVEILTRTIGTDGMGCQSYSEDNARSHFKDKLMPAYDRLPIWLKPNTVSGRTSDSLKLDVGKNDYGDEGLGTYADYATTSSSRFYDGKKKIYLLTDEAGKCFGYGTKVRMYDGSVKDVQDIKAGDVLMGDDSTPRNVQSTVVGFGKMFKVVPNYGDPWTCNEEHILPLKGSDAAIPGVKKGQYFKKTVKEFLRLSPVQKRNCVLYKRGVKYEEQEHSLDPYFFGMWIGDGNSSGAGITNVDAEVVDYFYGYAKRNSLSVKISENITYYFSAKSKAEWTVSNEKESRVFYSLEDVSVFFGITPASLSWKMERYGNVDGYTVSKKNPFTVHAELRKLNVLKNKHIPVSYLMDSESNRLELLAGIIDSDGYAATGNKMAYEVTQKNKNLAYNIRRLALDLGFASSVKEKIARMKREDGSIYECLVYRVFVYGLDLWRIPCKVERKKYHKKSIHPNTRNPLHTGFKIEPIGEDNYYGFVLDGNRKFLLEDNTVAHNTESTSVSDRHQVNKHTLAQGNGADIFGYMMYPSTVEELKEGAAHYRKLFNGSNFYERNSLSGQTESGLFGLFVPGDEGLDKYIDPYGHSVKGKMNDHYRKLGYEHTATEYLQAERTKLLAKGDPESMHDYRHIRKLFPLKLEDCWLGEAGDIGFDLEKIDKRLSELMRQSNVRVGNLEWVDGVFGGDVFFKDDIENGKFVISKDASDTYSNKKVRVSFYDAFKQKTVEAWRPMYPGYFTVGVDTFRLGGKSDSRTRLALSKTSKLSDGGIAVLWNYDPSLDGDRNKSDWQSYRFVLTYRHRHSNTDDFNEDVLKAAIWYGGMVFPETNVPNTYEYFVKHGFGGYLLYDTDKYSGRLKDKPGIDTLERSKQEIFSLWRDYIDYRCHVEEHEDLLRELKSIKELEQMRHFDIIAAGGVALMGAKSTYVETLRRVENNDYDYDDFIWT